MMKRLLKMMLILMTLAATLTACAPSMTIDQIESSDHKVTRLDEGTLFKQPTWEYTGPNGKETTLTVDCSTLFTNTCVENEDGSVRLVYFDSRYGRSDHKLEIDSQTWDMDCQGESWMESDTYCAPRLD